MFGILYLANIFLSIVYSLFATRAEKKIIIYAVMILIIIMGGAYDTADDGVYIGYYNASQYFSDFTVFDPGIARSLGGSRNYGYAFLNYMMYSMDLGFYSVRMFIAVVFLVLMVCCFSKISSAVLLFLSLYMMYPFLYDVIQIRNFILMVFLYLGIRELSYRNKYGSGIFGIIMAIGFLFHEMVLIYIPFLLFCYFLKNKVLKWISLFFVVIGMCMPLYASLLKNYAYPLMILIANDDNGFSRFEMYVKGESFGYYYYYLIIIMCLLVMCYLYIWSKKVSIDTSKKRYIKIVLYFFLYIVCFMPAFPMFSDFATRLVRNSLILLYTSLAIYYCNTTNIYNKMAMYGIVVVICLFCGRASLYGPDVIFNVVPIFENNIFWDEFMRLMNYVFT